MARRSATAEARFYGRGKTRRTTFTEGTTVRVWVPWWTWLTMRHSIKVKQNGVKTKIKIPRSREFNINTIKSIKWTNAGGIFAGRVLVDVPGHNDPWRGRPRKRFTKPYLIKFAASRQDEHWMIIAGLQLVRNDLIPHAQRGGWLRRTVGGASTTLPKLPPAPSKPTAGDDMVRQRRRIASRAGLPVREVRATDTHAGRTRRTR